MNYNDRYINGTEGTEKRHIVEIKLVWQDLATDKLGKKKKSKVMFQSGEFGDTIVQLMIIGKSEGSYHLERKIMTFFPHILSTVF